MNLLKKLGDKNALLQIMKFGAIGGGAAFFYVLLSNWALGHFNNIAKPIISALCYALFILPVYLLQHRFTFNNEAKHISAFPKYIMVQMLSLAFSYIFGEFALNYLQLPNFIGSVVVIVLTSMGSFIALKIWAFRKK